MCPYKISPAWRSPQRRLGPLFESLRICWFINHPNGWNVAQQAHLIISSLDVVCAFWACKQWQARHFKATSWSNGDLEESPGSQRVFKNRSNQLASILQRANLVFENATDEFNFL